MKVFIKSCVSGAGEARGVAVIIDVISASSTIVKLFEAGVKTVIPVDSLKKAKEMKTKNPNSLICAELRHKIKGIDLLNSPIVPKNLKGKTIIIKTNAGTKGLLGAKKANKVLVGCFLNSKAVVDYIKKLKPKEVSLVAMGNSGKSPAIEDEACALYLKSLLEGGKIDFGKLKIGIVKGSVKNILRTVFTPENISTALNVSGPKIVPEMVRGRLICDQKTLKTNL